MCVCFVCVCVLSVFACICLCLCFVCVRLEVSKADILPGCSVSETTSLESPGGSSACLPRLKPGLKSMNSIAEADLQDGSRSICVFLFSFVFATSQVQIGMNEFHCRDRCRGCGDGSESICVALDNFPKGGTNVLIRFEKRFDTVT